jgi:hypothetical protein
MPARRRFPLPWIVEELDACFVVVDCAGQPLAYVYFEDEPGRAFNATVMSRRFRDRHHRPKSQLRSN